MNRLAISSIDISNVKQWQTAAILTEANRRAIGTRLGSVLFSFSAVRSSIALGNGCTISHKYAVSSMFARKTGSQSAHKAAISSRSNRYRRFPDLYIASTVRTVSTENISLMASFPRSPTLSGRSLMSPSLSASYSRSPSSRLLTVADMLASGCCAL